MRMLCQSIMVKRELSTYSYKLWAVTKRMRYRYKRQKLGPGPSLRDDVRRSAIQEGLRGEQLLAHIKRSQLK